MSHSDSPLPLWQRLLIRKRSRLYSRPTSHTDLVVAGGIALYAFTLPLGYLVLWSLRKREREIGATATQAERKQFNNAKVLAQASLVLFWLVWAALLAGIFGHPVRKNTGASTEIYQAQLRR